MPHNLGVYQPTHLMLKLLESAWSKQNVTSFTASQYWYSETCVLRSPHRKWSYMTGGLLSQVQIYRNVGPCSYWRGDRWSLITVVIKHSFHCTVNVVSQHAPVAYMYMYVECLMINGFSLLVSEPYSSYSMLTHKHTCKICRHIFDKNCWSPFPPQYFHVRCI